MGGLAVDPWQSVRRTVALMVFGWLAAASNAYIAYLALGMEWVPFILGFLVCCIFAIWMSLLHRAWWLTVLSAVPALFILIGSVQYAPEAALEQRGVRENVVIVADTADNTPGDKHRLTLQDAGGKELEKMEYDSDVWAPKVGDQITIIRDPEGTVPLERAEKVDASDELGSLVGGTVGWTLMALLAGWRGHVRRRHGRYSLVDQMI
jgi:hypothetical protein